MKLTFGSDIMFLYLDDISNNEKNINHFMRDRNKEKKGFFDARLIKLLFEVSETINGGSSNIDIISGYLHNDKLTLLNNRSRHDYGIYMHTQGKAIDFNISKIPAEHVFNCIKDKFNNGIALYSGSENSFVHLDLGPKSNWIASIS